jgi:hypothetical protein
MNFTNTVINDNEILNKKYNSIKRELYTLLLRELNINYKKLRDSSMNGMCDMAEFTSILPDSIIRYIRCIHQLNEEFIHKDINSIYALDGSIGLLIENVSDILNPKRHSKSEMLKRLLNYTEERLRIINNQNNR